ncbi:AGGF1 [Cordylochernes scorpioides]|uniref:AGGF1 n=1 Tax=Cordylochernes scorpioides TaxID=51811 RepID=A0ABY6KU51_9ARAC|nr:AGGF1 [Cordylochernes scorpioides]
MQEPNNSPERDLEEGEIPSEESEESCETSVSSPEVMETELDEEVIQSYAPCIRAIVQASSGLKPGSLLVVPMTGAVIGRDLTAGLTLPDPDISKAHAQIFLDEEDKVFRIKDLGSRNGTVLNGERLSEGEFSTSQPRRICHADVLELGSTCRLLLHVHRNHETCDDCEPGVVQAAIQQNLESGPQILTKDQKEEERRNVLRQLKKKFGLKRMDFEVHTGEAAGYVDRSAVRRATKGSDNPYEKTEIPSGLDVSLDSGNKGFQMLQKMGWNKGQGLGKGAGQDNLEPVSLSEQVGTTGLGSTVIGPMNRSNQPIKWQRSSEVLNPT